MAIDEASLIEARAVRYYDAARLLHSQTTTPIQVYWEPLNHLLAMAAELTLKAFLMRSGLGAGALKQPKVRHSLKALLTLAIDRGLRASNEAVEPLLHMDRAHAEHSFRYTQNMAPEKVTVIWHAKPEAAIEGMGLLLDQAAISPASLRSFVGSELAWPLALPVQHPITSDQLKRWILEVESYQAMVESAARAGPKAGSP